MNEFAGHTPGPWFILSGHILAGSDNPMDDGDALAIADIDMDMRIDFDTTGAANAALIAAAPTLLAQRDALAYEVARLKKPKQSWDDAITEFAQTTASATAIDRLRALASFIFEATPEMSFEEELDDIVVRYPDPSQARSFSFHFSEGMRAFPIWSDVSDQTSAHDRAVAKIIAQRDALAEALRPFLFLFTRDEEGNPSDEIELMPDGHAWELCWETDGSIAPKITAGHVKRARAALALLETEK